MKWKNPKFSIIWYMHISKISEEERNLTTYYPIKQLMLLVSQSMMYVNVNIKRAYRINSKQIFR